MAKVTLSQIFNDDPYIGARPGQVWIDPVNKNAYMLVELTQSALCESQAIAPTCSIINLSTGQELGSHGRCRHQNCSMVLTFADSLLTSSPIQKTETRRWLVPQTDPITLST